VLAFALRDALDGGCFYQHLALLAAGRMVGVGEFEHRKEPFQECSRQTSGKQQNPRCAYRDEAWLFRRIDKPRKRCAKCRSGLRLPKVEPLSDPEAFAFEMGRLGGLVSRRKPNKNRGARRPL
jgi:hypothetical protein